MIIFMAQVLVVVGVLMCKGFMARHQVMVVVAVQHKHPVVRFVAVATVIKVVVAAVSAEEFPLLALVRPAPTAAVFGELHLATALQVERFQLLEPLVQPKLVLAGKVAAVAGLGTLR